jgi:inositol polyphosphate 5-phosphatase INPP5B/F
MASKLGGEIAQSLKPWKAGDPWGPAATLPGAFPRSPEPEPSLESAQDVPKTLSAAVKTRKSDYIRKKSLKLKVGTWNVAALSDAEKDLGAWFVGGQGVRGLSDHLSGLSTKDDSDDSDNGGNVESVEDQEARVATTKHTTTVPRQDAPAEAHHEQIDLYVLGLQEVIDVTSITEAVRPYTDPNPAKKWKKALRRALPRGYKKIAEEQLLGLLILIFASPELTPQISSVSTTSVGTGLMGYLGNKGAVSVRLVIGEVTKVCFVNCHLAAGADQAALARRIWDTNQILSRTRFSPIKDGELADTGEEKIGDEDFAFWFGDLNYRLDDIPGEDVRRLLLLHTQNEYDVENGSKRKIDSELGYHAPTADAPLPATQTRYEFDDAERPANESSAEPPLDPKNDPASLQTTLLSLLAHDQLRAQQRLGKAFHDGWREGDIDFLPTYKYDVGSVGMFDSGEKKRSPSWCDRILYRTRRDLQVYNEKAKLREESRKKDEVMKARGLDQATAEQDVLFDYDPATDGLAYGDDYDEYDEQQEGFHDAELVLSNEDYGDMVELNSYLSHQRILSSDHKPLGAVFTVAYDAVVPELKTKVQQEVAKQFDKAENEGRPSITLVVDHHSEESTPSTDGVADMNIVHFGEVRYGVKKTRAVTIANTGQITATFSFVERPSETTGEDARVVPKWLELSLESGSVYSSAHQDHKETYEIVLSPGDTTSIELTINITDGDLVHELNQGTIELEDILVLRVENGRDHFVPVKGTWLPSAFYRTLDDLVLAPDGGVRQWIMKPDDRANKLTSYSSTKVHHSAPKELYMLTEIIPVYIERSIAEWSMLHEGATPPWQYETGGNAWPFSHEAWTFHAGEERSDLLAEVREALDSAGRLDANFDPNVPTIVRLEVLAETLIAFLASLRDGIIPAETWTEVEGKLGSMDKAKTAPTAQEIQDMIMDALSPYPVHSVSLTFITFLLSRIVNEMMASGGPAPGLATPTTPTSTGRRSSRRSRASTMTSDSGPAPSTTSQEPPAKKSFFPVLRRNRTRSVSSASTTTEAAGEAAAVASERRSKLIVAYSEVFAPVIFRANDEKAMKVKDKKALDARKRRVLEAFLAEKHL